MHSTYRVEADNQAQAIAKLFAGEGQPVEQSQVFIEVTNDYGLPTDQYQDLAEALQKLGVPVEEAIIPSIRSIDEV